MGAIEKLLWLLFAHFIADWALQPLWIGTNKGKYWSIMTAHCMVYTACICVALKYIGAHFIPVFALITFITHYLTDWWKCKQSKEWNCTSGEEFPLEPLYVDQAFHIIVLMVFFFWIV